MNERIKELESQCWEPRQYGPAWFNSTKFAELIVRECIAMSHLHPNSTKNDEWQKGYAKGQLDAHLLIKHHFGVKE